MVFLLYKSHQCLREILKLKFQDALNFNEVHVGDL